MSLMFLLSSTIINICISSALFQFSFQVRCNANNGLTCRGISDTKTCLSPWFHLGLCLCGSLLWDLEEKKKKKNRHWEFCFLSKQACSFPHPTPHFSPRRKYLWSSEGILTKENTQCVPPQKPHKLRQIHRAQKFFIPPKNTQRRMLGWGRGGKKQTEKHPHHKTDDWRVLCCSNTI